MPPGETWSVVGYLVVVVAVALVASFFNRGSLDGYFLAGRSMNWIVVGVSLFSSHLGVQHFFYLTGTIAATGIAEGLCELVVVFGLLLLGWLFAGKYHKAKIFTMPEYLEHTLGGVRIKVYLSVLSLILNIGVKITVELYAAVRVVRYHTDTNIYCTLVLLGLAAFYTFTGGLTAVMWTNIFPNMAVMSFGCILLAHLGYSQISSAGGSYDSLAALFSSTSAANGSSGHMSHDPSMTHLFLPASDPNMPWPGTLGVLVCVVFVVAAGQVSVQNVLAARSVGHAQGGVLLAGLLQITFTALLVLTGMVARILFPDVIGCSDPAVCQAICGSPRCFHLAVPYLLRHVGGAWTGVVCLMLLAAHVSSLGADLNASSTIFTMDLWRTARKCATPKELMVIGRLSVLGLFLISALIVKLIVDSPSFILLRVAPTVIFYLAPSVCAIYLLSVLVPCINEKGAFWSLMLGLAVGLIRLVLDAVYLPPPYKDDLQPKVLKDFQKLHFAVFEFVLTVVVCVLVSVLTNNTRNFRWRCSKGCTTDTASLYNLDTMSSTTVTDVAPYTTPTGGLGNPGYHPTGDATISEQQCHNKPPGGATVVSGSEEQQETCFTQVPTFSEEKHHVRNKDGSTTLPPGPSCVSEDLDDTHSSTAGTGVGEEGAVQQVVQVEVEPSELGHTDQPTPHHTHTDSGWTSVCDMMMCPIRWLCGIERDVTVTLAARDDVTHQRHDLTQQQHDVTQQVQDVTWQQHDVTQQRHDVTQEGHDVTWQEHDVTQQQYDVTRQQHDVTQQRHDIAQLGHDVTQQQLDIKQQQHDVTQQPHDVTQQAHDVTQQAHDVTQQPHDVTQQPHDVTQQPHDVTQQPHDVTWQPHDVTQQAHDVTRQPHDVTQQAHDVTQHGYCSWQQAVRDTMAVLLVIATVASLIYFR